MGKAGSEGISIPATVGTGAIVSPALSPSVGAESASATIAKTLAALDRTSCGLGFGMMGCI